MPGESAIAWTEKTWNVGVVGCDEVNEGCDNCYARDWHNKWARVRAQTGNGPTQYNAPFSPARRMVDVLGPAAYQKRLEWPLQQRKPSMIFVNSMTDLYHSVATYEDIHQVFGIMHRADWHTYQILTKRYGRLRQIGHMLPWQSHIWQGISIASNKYLAAMSALSEGAGRAGVRFLSLEPILDDLIDLTPAMLRKHRIDWAIVGAESGTGNRGTGKHRRPIARMEMDWVRRIRDACVAADVAFFFKQSVDEHGHKTQLPALDGQVWGQFPRVAAAAARP